MQKEKILIVEDEKIVSIDLTYILNNLGYEVSGQISTGFDAINYVKNNKIDAILMDIGLKGEIDGIEAAIKIKESTNIPIVFVTANSDEKTLQRSKLANPEGYVLKPFSEREIRTTLEMAIFKHKSDLKLKASEEWLFTTLKSIGDAVIATDMNGNVKFMNHIAENLTGWNQDSAKDKPLKDIFTIINEYTRKTVENPVDKVFKEGKIVGLANHTILISKEGQEYHIDDAAAPIKDTNGIIDGIVLTFRDITEKRETETKLAETQNKFANFMDNSPLVSWIKDTKDWDYIYINKRFQDVFKLDNESIKGLTDFDIWDKKIAEAFRKNDLKVINENKSLVTYEYENDEDGKFRKWLSFKFPIQNSNGKTFVAGSALNITDYGVVEDKLNYNKQFLEAIFDNSESAYFLVDYTTGFIINCNKKALEIFEFESIEEIVGKTGSSLHKNPFTEEKMADTIKQIDEKMEWDDEIEYKTNKGNIFWGKIKAQKFTALNKEYNLVKITDITDSKIIKTRFDHLKNQINQIKKDFEELNNQSPELIAIIEKINSLSAI